MIHIRDTFVKDTTFDQHKTTNKQKKTFHRSHNKRLQKLQQPKKTFSSSSFFFLVDGEVGAGLAVDLAVGVLRAALAVAQRNLRGVDARQPLLAWALGGVTRRVGLGLDRDCDVVLQKAGEIRSFKKKKNR